MPKTRSRLAAIAAAAVLVVAAVAHTAYWFVLAGEVRAGIEGGSQDWRAAGYAVSHEELNVRGFPLSLRVRIDAPSVGRGSGAVAWRWRGEAITLSLRPWNLKRIEVRLDGAHEITVAEDARRYSLAATSATVTITLGEDNRLERLGAALAALEVRERGWTEPLQIGRLRLDGFRYRRAGGSRADIALVIEEAALPAAPQGPLGKTIARIRADVTVLGAFPERPIEAAMAAWRDDGGTVELRGLIVKWGALDFRADGTLALDSQLRPIGALSASIAGVDEAVASLVAEGSIGAAEAAAVRVAVNLLARLTSSDGDRVSVPITAQDGRLFIGPVAVAQIGPLAAAD